MQQINLYTSEFHPQRYLLNFRQLLIVTGLTLIIFSVMTWIFIKEEKVVLKQLAEEQQQWELIHSNFEEYEEAFSQKPDIKKFEDSIRKKEKLLQEKMMALNTLRNNDVSASKGFSEVLVSLAKSKSNRIWFTDIELYKNILKLKGQTLELNLITEWVENSLVHAELNRQFEAIAIEENQFNKNVYEFELRKGSLINHE